MALQNPTTCTQKDSKQVFELDPYVINCAYTENTEATWNEGATGKNGMAGSGLLT